MPDADDLKLIHGIGPAAEHRLHSVGVYTFAQLAALSAADLAAAVADLAGLSAERIIKQDWIGQARRLATISVEENRQQADEAEHASEPVTDKRPQGKEAAKGIPEEVVRVEQAGPRGVFYLSDLNIIAPEEYRRHTLLASDQSFEIALTLDLTNVEASGDSPLTYSASIHGKSLDNHSRLLVGHTQGSIPLLDSTVIKVQGTTLPQGLYRLEAIVTLTQAIEGHKQSPGLIAQMENRLLQCC